jgi:hypothetical protein
MGARWGRKVPRCPPPFLLRSASKSPGTPLGHFSCPPAVRTMKQFPSPRPSQVLFAATAPQPLCRRDFLHFFEPPQWRLVAAAKMTRSACAAGVVALWRFNGKGSEKDFASSRSISSGSDHDHTPRAAPCVSPSLQPKVFDAMISDARAAPVCSVSQNFLALGETFAGRACAATSFRCV